MNKHCFRTIFSKTLQRIVVVSELAKLAGKSESESMTSGAILQKICKIRPLAFSCSVRWDSLPYQTTLWRKL